MRRIHKWVYSLEAVELKPLDTSPGVSADVKSLSTVDVGRGEETMGCVVALNGFAVGTPDGNGNAGTEGGNKSLGNGGTAGTDGNAIVGAAAAPTPAVPVNVLVSWAITTPWSFTVATTSTATVRIFDGWACRRWNMRCARPMTRRRFCSRSNNGSSTSPRIISSSSSSDVASFDCTGSFGVPTSWARWR